MIKRKIKRNIQLVDLVGAIFADHFIILYLKLIRESRLRYYISIFQSS